MPSNVMSIALSGKPLMVESRTPCGVFTPAIVETKLTGLRVTSGRLMIWLVLSVVETFAVCV